MNNLMRSKYSIIFLVIFIIFLYVLLNRGIVPWVTKVLDSSVFLEEDKEDEQLGSIKNQRSDFAMMNCREAAKTEGVFPDNAEFVDNKYEAWALGNRTYIIRSSVRIIDPQKGQTEQPFACKIKLNDGDETDAHNWSVLGIDTNDEATGE